MRLRCAFGFVWFFAMLASGCGEISLNGRDAQKASTVSVPTLPEGARVFQGTVAEEVRIAAGERALLVDAPVFERRVIVEEGATLTGGGRFLDGLEIAGQPQKPVFWQLTGDTPTVVAKARWNWAIVQGQELTLETSASGAPSIYNSRLIDVRVNIQISEAALTDFVWSNFTNVRMIVSGAAQGARLRLIGSELERSAIDFGDASQSVGFEADSSNFLELDVGESYFRSGNVGVAGFAGTNYFLHKDRLDASLSGSLESLSRRAWIAAPFVAGPGALEPKTPRAGGLPALEFRSSIGSGYFYLHDGSGARLSAWFFQQIARRTLEDELRSFSMPVAEEPVLLQLRIGDPTGCEKTVTSRDFHCREGFKLDFGLSVLVEGEPIDEAVVQKAFASLDGPQAERRTRLATIEALSSIADRGYIVPIPPTSTPYF